ncbi:RNA polymerase-associated protein RapA [Marinicella sp. S1101]|uniref:RNA polymerase-associated protein RapA n=1 Tax=Marinicella marina TaxID=2996016 RepID=UPI002260B05A|nr:RNA polymerase-associated protein RapA [Marinicella marina]MCX7554978.1 RNA polymerase-associated protein RapA [Marinicella marina]MDJ1141588.1 RNA polymerase-associated protein RapA [Marinicella marina]
MQFTIGQRYINNADLQLGLGRVTAENHRMVKVMFDAVEEERIYAKDSAPLSRYEAQVDDVLQHKDGWHITVNEVKNLNGLNIYFGYKDDGQEDVIPESEINNNISLDRPADRLLNAQIDKLKWYDLRQAALRHQQRLRTSELFGLTGCRTALLPHQLYIAHSVGKRHAPRVLLADEVGLGKTIEACLILHQQLLTNRAQRAIIIVPESLTHQWMVELLRRFNLQVSVFDEEKCQEIELSSGFENPFESSQLVLLPLEMILENPLREEQILAADWDLMVVDEAHHLEWFEGELDENQAASDSVMAYQIIESFALKIPGVLLLTATPEQLGRKSHFARLRLLDPDRYHDFEQFLAEEAEFEQVADAIEALIDAVNLEHTVDTNAIVAMLAGHINEDLLEQIQNLGNDPEAGQAVINQLLDQHGTGRVLFRNTRGSVSGFPQRELNSHVLPLPKAYQNTTAQEVLTPETALDEEVSGAWLEYDTRVTWLCEKIKQLKHEKMLIIASQAATVLQLEDHLREAYGIHVAVFHEGMSLIERDQAAAWFADIDNGTHVLLCSEIGSEGRNFQFAHHLLFFDLPAHPDLLEQRIGRLDRIGQTETIQIHVPYFADSAQERWFQWYHHGLNLFTQTNPAAHHVYSAFAAQLNQQLDTKALSKLLADSQKMSQELLSQMTKGRDRLLEYNSCRPAEAASLTADAENFQQSEQLERFMHKVFDLFGVHYEEHRAGSEIIRPTDEMDGYFPFLIEDGMTITYDREIALANETFHYITWEHPMVNELLELIINQEKGNTAFAVLKDSGLNAGQIFLECRYLIQASGKSSMQLARYLPPINRRFLLAESGVEVGSKLTEAVVNKFKNAVPMNVAVEVLKAKLSVVKLLLEKADDMMQQQLPEIKQQAEVQVSSNINHEIKRLKQLANNNGQVRDIEIDHLQQNLTAAITTINNTQPQLDSIRVLVTM